MKIASSPREGAAMVETAVVASALMIIIIGFLVVALGVFRYQQVASLAREGARYASVRGARYELSTGNAAATKEDVYNHAIKPNTVILDLSQLSYDVTWSPDKRQGSMVSVRVTYRWLPEAFFSAGDLTSTSSVRVSY